MKQKTAIRLRNFFGQTAFNFFVNVPMVILLWQWMIAANSPVGLQLLMYLSAWHGVLTGTLLTTLFIVQWASKAPARVTWFDTALGFGGTGWSICMSAWVLWETHFHTPAPDIIFLMGLGTAGIGLTLSMLQFRKNPHREPLYIKPN